MADNGGDRKIHNVEMQSKNREPPSKEMSDEEKKRWDLLTKQLHSWVDSDTIHHALQRGEPKIYWGTATTGKPHLGYFVPIYKISDFLAAGCRVTILFANLHGFLDNMKSSWEVLNKRMEFYEIVIKGMLEFIGVPLDKLTFVRGTEFQLGEKYTLDMYRMAAAVTTEHTTKAGAEVVKQVANPLMSNLLYPILQALDEEYLDVDIQFGGVDQRKIFMFAREKLPLIGYKKRAYLMNPLIPGLGESGKMSSSIVDSKIDFDDSDEEIQKKIKKAFSKDGEPDGNGLLAITKYILFRVIEKEGRSFLIPRPEKYGGSIEFKTYEEVEKAFGLKEDDKGKLFSGDLKRGVIKELLPMIGHMRKIIEANIELRNLAYPEEKNLPGKQQQGKGGKQAAKGAGGKGKGKGGGGGGGNEIACPSRVDLRVGHVVDVKIHPSSDTLFVEEIDVGEDKPRQIVSGLKEYISMEDFKGRKVVVFCNLKPSNFRAVRSEGMVLTGEAEGKVELLDPPPSSKPGDLVSFGDKQMKPDAVIDPKKKNNIWNGEKATPAPLNASFRIDENGHAFAAEHRFHIGGEPITVPNVKNGRIL